MVSSPDFPISEYKKRYENIQKTMEKNDIDAMLLNENENMTYFSGFRPILSGQSKDRAHMYHFILLPRNGLPILILPLPMRGNAETMSWIDDVRFFLSDWTFAPFLSVPPKDPIDLIIETIEELDLMDKVIGFELGEGTRLDMSQKDFELIKMSLPKAKILDVSNLIKEVRSIKSKLEIKHISEACRITCKAFRSIQESIEEGMTEREIAAIFYKTIIDEGIDEPYKSFLQIRSGKDRYGLSFTRPSNYRIKKGDIVMTDGGATYKGYWADMTRLACIGEPSTKQKKIYECAIKSQEAGLNSIKEGVSVRAVASSILDTAVEMGCRRNLPYISYGHGIGLVIHEPPYLSMNEETTLRSGMVLTVEPTFYDSVAISYMTKGIGDKGSDGVFYVEDDIVVTKDGYENLTPLSKELLIVK